MKNVSVKTKNGLKDAQKNVKGRPTVTKKAVIMATDRPPQTPSKDYKHYTPEVDDHDDGWGSDFSDQSDVEHVAVEEEDSFSDDEYEEPQQPFPMPQSSSAPQAPPHNNRRDPPIPVVTALRGSPVVTKNTRRSLPPEPPTHYEEQETYEDPNQQSSDEPEDYEEPVDIPSSLRPPQRLPPKPPSPSRMVSPAHRHPHSQPGPLPPRIPITPKPELDTYEIQDGANGWEEDYEQPEKAPNRVPPAEIISVSGRLRPSDVAKKNYTKVEIPKPEVKPVQTWVDQSGQGVPLRPSQLKWGQTNTPSPVPKESVSDRPPQIPSSNKTKAPFIVPKLPNSERPSAAVKDRSASAAGLPERNLPRPPEDQEIEGLYSYTWYHSDVTRTTASEKLLARSKNGMFLVRKSTREGSPYALSLFYGGRIYNLNIRRRTDNKYALGTKKPDEKAFSGVPSLISFFQNNTLVLGGDTSKLTTLVQALPK